MDGFLLQSLLLSGSLNRIGKASDIGTKVSCPCSSASHMASAPNGLPALTASAHSSLAVCTACKAGFIRGRVLRAVIVFNQVRVGLDVEIVASHGDTSFAPPNRMLRWSRLSEQFFRVDKWSVCRG